MLYEVITKEHRLAYAQRLARLGNWQWEKGDSQVSLSEEAFRILGLPWEKSGLGLKEFFACVHPQDRLLVRKGLDQLWHTPELFSLDYRVVTSYGLERFVHGQAEVVLDPVGKIVRLVGTIQDIGERKRTEEKLLLAGKVFDNSYNFV